MFRYLLEKEFKQFFRNAFLPRLVLMMPLMMMLVMPWAANQEVKDVRLCIVDHDRSTASSRLTQKIVSSSYFKVTAYAPSYTAALSDIGQGTAEIILEIPLHFEQHLRDGDSAPQVFIAANAVNGTRSTIAATYLANIIASAGASLEQKQATMVPTVAKADPISATFRYNPNLDYIIYMVPALMVMLLTMLTGFLPALNIVSEKEAGTIEQINVSPVGKFQFVLSKLLPYWLIGLFVMTLCMVLGVVVYNLSPAGSWITLYAFAAVYILVVSGMGLVISNYSATMQQAMFVMYFFVMILLLMSGLLTPIGSMPQWAQWIAAANPLKYFVEVMRAIYLKGSTFSDIITNLYTLTGFALFFNLWAIVSYRKQE